MKATQKSEGGDFDLNGDQIGSIPIVKTSIENQLRIEAIVKDIIEKCKCPNANISPLQNELNNIIFNLYGLTDDEKSLI